ncbi:amino acid/amide ABC transporter ATP-binding protein 2, HAAT family [Longilinea arvoryzae]|uniref:Amino acid/amide ABC transporter ATP-binding protein 2, HAAT family n=2 Tax=Longilinea arvoryzae TaxID=360412 RepID=A0A0K8MXU1_9CHLR|nr:amino acid/amide ABC transporter ATP-binding protein 2, HAAT family [Longilinea arvoryzae]
MSASNLMLEVKNLTISYGNIKAVKGISFEVHEGEIVTLIGANGAGKSSTLRAISGVIPWGGEINYRGKTLKGVPADRIVAMGIAQVPEGRGIFGSLTVQENLKLATWQRKDKSEISKDFERVFTIFPRLKERLSQPGGTLSGGEQQMLAVARALMSRGSMVLLDEPSMGLAPVLVQEIFRVISEMNASGTTVLLVEQNANMALRHANRGYVLETGTISMSGSGEQLLGDARVKEAYLGG